MRKFLILLIATSISLIGCDGINYYEKEDVVLTAGLIKSLGYNENSTVFNLRNLKITHISADAFNYFPNAVKIDLSYNKIKEINKETFDGLFVLIELLLNNNEIKHIGPNSFDSLVNLKLINLSFNQLRVFNAPTFNALINIVELYISNNHIEFLDWDNILNENLEVFDVHSNEITFMSLCNGTVTLLCPSVNGPFPIDFKFRVVDLSNNKLKAINEFDYYTTQRIEYLILSHNEIEYIHPRALLLNSALINLQLDYNRIRQIEPYTFDSLINLRILNLSYNELKSFVARTFNPLIYLIELNISFNHLKSIDWDNLKIVSLEILDAQSNEIDHLSLCNGKKYSKRCPDFNGPFPYKFKLKNLNLKNNQLKKVSQYDFYRHHHLEIIVLSYNQIERIDSGAFVQNTELKELRLDYNKLKQINKDTFDGLLNLNILNLDFNQIKEFSKYALVGLKDIKLICLYENPIDKSMEIKEICTEKSNPKCVIESKKPCKLDY